MSLDQFGVIPEGFEIAPWQDVAAELVGNHDVVKVEAEVGGITLKKYFWKQWITRAVDSYLASYSELMPVKEYIEMSA